MRTTGFTPTPSQPAATATATRTVSDTTATPPTINTCDAGTPLKRTASRTTTGNESLRVNNIAVRPNRPPSSKNPAKPDAARPSDHDSPDTTIKRSTPVIDPPPTSAATSTAVSYRSDPAARATKPESTPPGETEPTTDAAPKDENTTATTTTGTNTRRSRDPNT